MYQAGSYKTSGLPQMEPVLVGKAVVNVENLLKYISTASSP